MRIMPPRKKIISKDSIDDSPIQELAMPLHNLINPQQQRFPLGYM